MSKNKKRVILAMLMGALFVGWLAGHFDLFSFLVGCMGGWIMASRDFSEEKKPFISKIEELEKEKVHQQMKIQGLQRRNKKAVNQKTSD